MNGLAERRRLAWRCLRQIIRARSRVPYTVANSGRILPRALPVASGPRTERKDSLVYTNTDSHYSWWSWKLKNRRHISYSFDNFRRKKRGAKVRKSIFKFKYDIGVIRKPTPVSKAFLLWRVGPVYTTSQLSPVRCYSSDSSADLNTACDDLNRCRAVGVT